MIAAFTEAKKIREGMLAATPKQGGVVASEVTKVEMYVREVVITTASLYVIVAKPDDLLLVAVPE